jgi:glycosyltransferase involved in cell wall biosynthesis
MWEMLFEPPDVLFTPAHSAPLLSRAKIVITIHDVGFKALPKLYSWQDKLYHRFSTWWNCKFAWRIIVPSEFTKDELVKFYKVNPKKVCVIYHGAPEPPPHLALSAGHSSLSEEGKQSYLLFVGRLEKKKNILNIVKAFEIVKKTHPELKLVLAGRPGFGFNEIQDYLNLSPNKESVKIKGYIKEEEKWRLYRSAEALVFPTLYEGFGIPILEAQSAGCPVITSNQGANKEIAGENAILVDPYDAKKIAAGIINALGYKGGRNEKNQKTEKNLTRFSWKQTGIETLQAISA